MSGGLFDQPLFDAPDKPHRKSGTRRRPADEPVSGGIKPAAGTSVSGQSLNTDKPAALETTSASGGDRRVSDIGLPQGQPAATPPAVVPVHSVSEVNGLIGRVLQAQLPAVLRVRGEISNFNVYSKGHAFFKLKDQRSELPCMMWRNDLEKLRFSPADGLAVIADGEVKLYEPQGRLQLYVHSMIPQGAGELELAFRQLCDKLRAEGLFDAARKRPIPAVPRDIVVITSATGDVFHDVLTTACRRFPNIHIMLFPVQVQGAPAAGDIVRAIECVNAHAAAIGGVDLILLVRGGGSLEDLWAFNEEAVARAMVRSGIPIVTGIGHEPDVTIADLVADLRGPTPTGAAAMAVADKAALHRDVQAQAEKLVRELSARWRESEHILARRQAALTDEISRMVRTAAKKNDLAGRQIAAIEPRHAIAQGWRRLENATQQLRQGELELIRQTRERLSQCASLLQSHGPQSRRAQYHAVLMRLSTQLVSAMRHKLLLSKQRLADLEKQLDLAGPMQVLKRGFTITTDAKGVVIQSAIQVNSGEMIQTRTADGSFGSVVK